MVLFCCVVVDLLFYVPHIVCGDYVLVFVLLCITTCLFYFFNHLDEEESVRCFALFVLLVGMQSVIKLFFLIILTYFLSI